MGGAQVMASKTSTSSQPKCFTFCKGESLGGKGMKALLGGKGANLCEMARIGLNVPPGFTITTEMCEAYHKAGDQLPEGLWEEVLASLDIVSKAFGREFASLDDLPLLLSVRSGAAVSMPGMMDTVLNLGLNDKVAKHLAQVTDTKFAYDCYRRLLDMYANVVLGADHDEFEEALAKVKADVGVEHDVDLSGEDLQRVVEDYKGVYVRLGLTFPTEPLEQLREAIGAVFKSWQNPRAVKYRALNRIVGLRGTAVNVQAMVYGNLNSKSGTGVCFTRNPSTGERALYGEYLMCAQGEDVVAGIRTPQPLVDMRNTFTGVYEELLANTTSLENHMKDMQDCEFTVENGVLFMLQTRNGKRAGAAALRAAIDMTREGLLTQREAVLKVEPRHLDQLLHPQFADPKAYAADVVATGLAASPGAAVGQVVFSASEAEARAARGESVILVRTETSAEDVGGMHAAKGILTSRGGMTSHAAVVARGWGKPCVCGCDTLHVKNGAGAIFVKLDSPRGASPGSPKKRGVSSQDGLRISEGDWLSLNGTTGEVILGKQELKAPEEAGDLAEFMSWADDARHLKVLANCDTPEDTAIARKGGAQGVGLVRTEHMFFSSVERIAAVRRMIIAADFGDEAGEHNEHALRQVQKFQAQDFQGILEAMDGLPVTIRLMDPPLHEFLPKVGTPQLEELAADLSKEMGIEPADICGHVERMQETNPMMGLRGCRLGILYPKITQMQVGAIVQAAIAAIRSGHNPHPRIMVPLVADTREFTSQLALIQDAITATLEAAGSDDVLQAVKCDQLDIKVGTMIEIPRAAIIAGELAEHAAFFSFGTNDLSQMTYGFSRDDAESTFLPEYLSSGILAYDPFERVDEAGVGALIAMACERGLATNPELPLGVCGEHGGNPDSIAFFDGIPGMAYVSCSPLRVPIARLAAAQSAIEKAGA